MVVLHGLTDHIRALSINPLFLALKTGHSMLVIGPRAHGGNDSCLVIGSTFLYLVAGRQAF